MKKILAVGMAAAIGLASTAAFAQSNVYSRNAVGYITVTVPPAAGSPPAGGFVLAGFNFKPVGADTITIRDLFGTNQLVKAVNNVNTRATRVFLWDPTSGGGGGYLPVYQKTNGLFYTTVGNIQTNPSISAGQAFWIQSPDTSTVASTVTFAGEVVSTNTFGQMLPASFQLMANPYAAPLDMNGTGVNWVASGATASNRTDRSDQAWIWNGSTYIAIYLRASPSNKWVYQVGNAYATNAILAPGMGAWYKAIKPYTNSLVRPYPWW